MVRRLKLHSELLKLTTNVYYQPPSTYEMDYPCIRYTLSKDDVKYANNQRYINKDRYQLTIIDEDPDSDLPDKVKTLPLCQLDRTYVANDLNHWVFNLYF